MNREKIKAVIFKALIKVLVRAKTGCLGSLRVPWPEITKLSHIGIMGFPMTRAETAALEPTDWRITVDCDMG
ncbi:MAG: hypothetical protein KTR27_10150, partial [Leptolyngbyaceae cyanobacterium MAG.088]|nr:hypothetical protein [Leptolyngbyaceae cyanobacterium MAG.088]